MARQPRSSRANKIGRPAEIHPIQQSVGEKGLVSVLIPTYNRGYIIGPTIESVLSQSYKNIEIVIVDDGSTDDTRAVVETFGPQVRYIYQKNAGLAAARNTSLGAARGEFVAFLDSDDLWVPWKLQAQVELMNQYPDLVLSWTDMTAISPKGEVLYDRYLRTMYHAYRKFELDKFLPVSGQVAGFDYRYGDCFSPMFMGNLVHPPTAMMRRSVLHRSGGLDATFAWTCEDYEFFWRVCREGMSALIEAPGMLYRVDAQDQLTRPDLHLDIAKGNLMALQRRLAADRHRFGLSEKEIRRHLAEAYTWIGEEELYYGEAKKSFLNFVKGLWLYPFQPRALLLWPFSFLPSEIFDFLRGIKSLF